MESPRLYKEGSFDYYLDNYPPAIRIMFEEKYIEHELANGGSRIYHIGYKMLAKLIWEDSICMEDQYDKIREIVNTHDSFNFYPYPKTYPNYYFNVRIMNGMNVSEWHWVDNGYIGTLELATTTNLTSIPTRS